MTWLVVAQREFFFLIRSREWFLVTFLSPLVMLFFLALSLIPALFIPAQVGKEMRIDWRSLPEKFKEFSLPEEQEEKPEKFALQVPPVYFYDESGVMKTLRLPEHWSAVENLETVREKVQTEKMARGLWLPKGFPKEGNVMFFTKFRWDEETKDKILGALIVILYQQELAKYSPTWKDEEQKPGFTVQTQYIPEQEAEDEIEATIGKVQKMGKNFGLVFVFYFLFFVSLMFTESMLMYGLAEEKENRLGELLLSCVTPTEMMWGKLIGIGLAGLIQVSIWLSFLLIPVLLIRLVLPFSIPVISFLLALGFFILGFFIYGSLVLGFGATGSTYREITYWSLIFTLPSIIPMMLFPVFMFAPEHWVVKLFAYFPLTSPVTMFFLIAVQPASLWWDIGLAFLIDLLSIVFFVRLAGRVFRMTFLIYGKRPTLRQILRWMLTP